MYGIQRVYNFELNTSILGEYLGVGEDYNGFVLLNRQVLICHSGLGIENTVSQRIQTNMHKIGKMVLQWK